MTEMTSKLRQTEYKIVIVDDQDAFALSLSSYLRQKATLNGLTFDVRLAVEDDELAQLLIDDKYEPHILILDNDWSYSEPEVTGEGGAAEFGFNVLLPSLAGGIQSGHIPDSFAIICISAFVDDDKEKALVKRLQGWGAFAFQQKNGILTSDGFFDLVVEALQSLEASDDTGA